MISIVEKNWQNKQSQVLQSWNVLFQGGEASTHHKMDELINLIQFVWQSPILE